MQQIQIAKTENEGRSTHIFNYCNAETMLSTTEKLCEYSIMSFNGIVNVLTIHFRLT